jgi:E3 ubiquitin-protein ligase synoviolin
MQDPTPNNDEERRRHDEMERMLLEQEALEHEAQAHDDFHNAAVEIPDAPPPNNIKKFKLSYSQLSFGAAFGLLWYALRTRQQWYLALVFLGSSKYAYIILANALVAASWQLFELLTNQFLGGLRLMEREGLGDFFRWNITETCLALTMFRAELSVESGILFLILVLGKCLHWVVEQRESHLRMTEDAIVTGKTGLWKGFPLLTKHQIGLYGLLQILLIADVLAVVCCIQHVATEGPSVMLLFGFEAAILLVSCMSLTLLWNLHVLDGFLHYRHDVFGYSQMLHAWKDRKATLIFAMEVQAQGAKFLFYCAFFAICFTYYGLPINLFREVYVSFQTLKLRLLAFSKYRKLVQSMNRFPAPPEDHDDMSCIICRDQMSVRDSKQLPGCGHVFHTCCLREWLVQQQTCPTCRGDIRVSTRAQQAQENAAAAMAAVLAIDEEELRQEALGMAYLEQQRQGMPGVVQPPRDVAEAEDKEDPVTAAKTGTPTTIGQKYGGTTRHPSARDVAPPQEQQRPSSVFPALYKVVAPQGAPVFQVLNSDSTRVIPTGTAVLCLEMELQTCNDDLGLMLRIPGGGWVWEDQVEYLTSVAAPSV